VDVSKLTEKFEDMHNNDFDILRHNIENLEHEASLIRSGIKHIEEDIERNAATSGNQWGTLIKLFIEIRNEVIDLEKEGKKKDARIARLEDEQIARIEAIAADCASGAGQASAAITEIVA